MAQVRILGVRHHSPACARLVAELLRRERPAAVLIEGPSDFNARLGELLLDHTLPLALHSYANEAERPAQCWFPFLEYSPEWVALRRGHESGALVRFIDLPHWQYRARPHAERVAELRTEQGRSRYAQVVSRLCAKFACDGDHALWDHLFESVAPEAYDELLQRLDLYFDELRADDPGDDEDRVREARMAEWIAWAARSHASVLVVCGGWHRRALLDAWPKLHVTDEPAVAPPADTRLHGSYLVPYEYRQVEALGGYGAGMQSPQFYQWAWQHGLDEAARLAVRAVVRRLRTRNVPVSTADFVALERTLAALQRLRGHDSPLRTDVLDAVQSAFVKEALEQPTPWARRGVLTIADHPALREALLALTGEAMGKLHPDTPLPPLLHDVDARLAAAKIAPVREPQKRIVDRRREDDESVARTLWQLQLIGVSGVRLAEMRAPGAARGLAKQLAFEEHWSIVTNERWYPDLIEAAAYGATLESAARNRLLESVHDAAGNAAALAECLLRAVRAGLVDMGTQIAQQLARDAAQLHDHGALADAAQVLVDVAHAGFWGTDARTLLDDTLGTLAERILWLLDGRSGGGDAASPQAVQDVKAVAVVGALLKLQIAGLDAQHADDAIHRYARLPDFPAAQRGAALGVAWTRAEDPPALASEATRIARAIPPREQLGDFLYGLFCTARAEASTSEQLVAAVHSAVISMTHEDFLVALPRLRAAFGWFPPRERGAMAARIATALGLKGHERAALTSLRGSGTLVDAKRVEAQALAWAREFGVVP